jgi:GNAT superfamily N-acetyltransferase
MGKIMIIRAGLEDLDSLMEWRMEVLHQVFSLSDDFDTTQLEAENRRYYRQQLPQGGHIACFARIDGVTVGCGGVCLYEEMPSPDNANGKCAYLMNIYCREPYRHQGVGHALVRWLVGQVQASGIRKIYLETSDSGRPLYQSLGFRDMENMMHL